MWSACSSFGTVRLLRIIKKNNKLLSEENKSMKA